MFQQHITSTKEAMKDHGPGIGLSATISFMFHVQYGCKDLLSSFYFPYLDLSNMAIFKRKLRELCVHFGSNVYGHSKTFGHVCLYVFHICNS